MFTESFIKPRNSIFGVEFNIDSSECITKSSLKSKSGVPSTFFSHSNSLSALAIKVFNRYDLAFLFKTLKYWFKKVL